MFESVCPACSRQVARRGVQLVPIHVTSVSEHAITHVPSFNAGRLEGRNVYTYKSPLLSLGSLGCPLSDVYGIYL